jgi:hypothetical protein
MELMTDKGYYPSVGVWHMMPKLMGPSRPVGWLCTDDLGAIAARVFADPKTWGDADLNLVADVESIDQCKAIWREVRGQRPRGFPMPVRLFERFAGTDLTTMWRWLRTAEFDMSTEAREILPEALTVREWLCAYPRPRRHKSRLTAPGRTKINSFDPPLSTVCTAYPTEPLLSVSHEPIELPHSGPGSRLHLDRRVAFAAICLGTPLYLGVAEIHI